MVPISQASPDSESNTAWKEGAVTNRLRQGLSSKLGQ